jgi:hypothetical protein
MRQLRHWKDTDQTVALTFEGQEVHGRMGETDSEKIQLPNVEPAIAQTHRIRLASMLKKVLACDVFVDINNGRMGKGGLSCDVARKTLASTWESVLKSTDSTMTNECDG